MQAPELPQQLRDGIERELASVGGAELARASRVLSDRYRSGERGAPIARTRADVLAYAATRLPATYGAVAAALAAVREQRPGWEPRTVLDLGAGPGAGLWAASVVWPSLARATAVEAAPEMAAAGRSLARAGPALVRDAEWRQGELGAGRVGEHDLVLVSYVLGELAPGAVDGAVDLAWRATAGTLAVVEPGTPDGYRRVLGARTRLLAGGAFTTAPCPHDAPCPLAGGDWCHFGVRVQRSAAHRAAKGAALGHEDEKYSYVAVSRAPTGRTDARVLRHPQIRPGHVQLELCTDDGLQRVVVSKRRETYRRARKLAWGDAADRIAERPGVQQSPP